jgi:hypothetical protein
MSWKRFNSITLFFSEEQNVNWDGISYRSDYSIQNGLNNDLGLEHWTGDDPDYWDQNDSVRKTGGVSGNAARLGGLEYWPGTMEQVIPNDIESLTVSFQYKAGYDDPSVADSTSANVKIIDAVTGATIYSAGLAIVYSWTTKTFQINTPDITPNLKIKIYSWGGNNYNDCDNYIDCKARELLIDEIKLTGSTRSDIIEYSPVTYQNGTDSYKTGISSERLYINDFVQNNTLSVSFDTAMSEPASNNSILVELIAYYSDSNSEKANATIIPLSEWANHQADFTFQDLAGNYVEYVELNLYYGNSLGSTTPTLYLDNFELDYLSSSLLDTDQSYSVDVPLEKVEGIPAGSILIPLTISGFKNHTVKLSAFLLDNETTINTYSYINSPYDSQNGTPYPTLPDYIRIPFSSSDNFDAVRFTLYDLSGQSQSGQIIPGMIQIVDDQPDFDLNGTDFIGSSFISANEDSISFYHPDYITSNDFSQFIINYDSLVISDQTYIEFSKQQDGEYSDISLRVTASGISADIAISDDINKIRIRNIPSLENTSELESISYLFTPLASQDATFDITVPTITYGTNNSAFDMISGHITKGTRITGGNDYYFIDNFVASPMKALEGNNSDGWKLRGQYIPASHKTITYPYSFTNGYDGDFLINFSAKNTASSATAELALQYNCDTSDWPSCIASSSEFNISIGANTHLQYYSQKWNPATKISGIFPSFNASSETGSTLFIKDIISIP